MNRNRCSGSGATDSWTVAFALVTPGIVVLAVSLSLALGLIAGFLAAQRLVHVPPLELLTGRREARTNHPVPVR